MALIGKLQQGKLTNNQQQPTAVSHASHAALISLDVWLLPPSQPLAGQNFVSQHTVSRHQLQAAANIPALQKQSNPSGVTGITKPVQDVVSKEAQQASEAVIRQGGTKDQANAAAQKASAAAVSAANKLEKDNPNATPQALAQAAKDAATPVVNTLSKDMNANVGAHCFLQELCQVGR